MGFGAVAVDVELYFAVFVFFTQRGWVVGAATSGNDACVEDASPDLELCGCFGGVEDDDGAGAVADVATMGEGLLQGEGGSVQLLDTGGEGLGEGGCSPGLQDVG